MYQSSTFSFWGAGNATQPYETLFFLSVLMVCAFLCFLSLAGAGIMYLRIHGKLCWTGRSYDAMSIAEDKRREEEAMAVTNLVDVPRQRAHGDRVFEAFLWLAAIGFCLMVTLLVSWDKLHPLLGMAIWLLVLSFCHISFMYETSAVLLQHLEWPSVQPQARTLLWRLQYAFRIVEAKARSKPFQFYTGIVVIFIVSILVNALLAGVCFSLHPSSITTRASRLTSSHNLCARVTETLKPGPCWTYLTAPSNPSREMFVTFHVGHESETTTKFRDSKVRLYNAVGDAAFTEIAGPRGTYLWRLRNDVFRTIHWVHLTNLMPNTTYEFDAGNTDLGFSKKFTFRTLPADDRPIKLVFGGDTGTGKDFTSILEASAKEDPDLIVFGGDLAYDNSMASCYGVWDSWFQSYTTAARATVARHLIPFVTAVGNHDTGLSLDTKLADLNWLASAVPFYLPYFIFKPDSANGRSPLQDINQESLLPWARSTVNSFTVGPSVSLVLLDTGHLIEPTSALQTDMIKTGLRPGTLKIASYHVPMFPSRRKSDSFQTELMTSWGPALDAARANIVFENHDHLVKQTYPLRFNSEGTPRLADPSDAAGMYFVGDGGFGAESDDPPMNIPFFSATKSSARHFWLLTLVSNQTPEGNVTRTVTFGPMGQNRQYFFPPTTRNFTI